MVEETEVTELDLIYEAHDKVDVLISILIEKGIITQEEFETKFEEHLDSLEDEE